MSNSNRFIRIAQQPPAIVFRGDLFNFFAYFPKQGPYGHQEDVQAHHHHHPRAGQDGFTTYFATINVIPAYDRKLPLSWSSSSSSLLKKGNDEMMIGKSRADFNRENENDRTIRFELGIKCTGTFIVVVRLHRQQLRPPREGGSGGNYIITSVATRKIQVVERQEQNDTRFNHAWYGRLAPPPMEGEEKEHRSFHLDEPKPVRTVTRFNGERDLPRPARLIMQRPKNVSLPEVQNSGSNEMKGKKSQPGVDISNSTPYQQNVRRDDSKPGEDGWSDDEDGDDEGGVDLLSRGRLIMPRPNSILPETKNNDGDSWSDDDDSDDEGGIELF